MPKEKKAKHHYEDKAEEFHSATEALSDKDRQDSLYELASPGAKGEPPMKMEPMDGQPTAPGNHSEDRNLSIGQSYTYRHAWSHMDIFDLRTRTTSLPQSRNSSEAQPPTMTHKSSRRSHSVIPERGHTNKQTEIPIKKMMYP